MNFIEYPIAHHANGFTHSGTIRCFRSTALSDIVESIWDCDIPDSAFAKTLTIKCAPGTALSLVGQYRSPADMRLGTRLLPTKCATYVHSQGVTLRPTGALGVIIVCLRPDAANRIVAAPLKEFANADIKLGCLFGDQIVATCDDSLAEARTSNERVAGVEAILTRLLRPRAEDLASCVALHLGRDPTMQMNVLAAKLGFSDRHIARAFKASFGMSPKRFARLARFQKILAGRRSGGSWAQIAHACGLTDQAHLIREFRDFVGESPTEFFNQSLCIGGDGPSAVERFIIHGPAPADGSAAKN